MSTAHQARPALPDSIPPAPRPIEITVQVPLTVLAIPEASGGYSLVVPALYGCFSQAETIEEAAINAAEAAEGWLAVTHDRNTPEALRMATEPLDGEVLRS